MLRLSSFTLSTLLVALTAFAAPTTRDYVNYFPNVASSYDGIAVTYNGFLNTSSGLEEFLGKYPYAAPPVGSLRFMRPEPYVPSGAISINATLPPPICKQPSINSSVEDCLTLDITRHSGVQSGEKLPVLVWIYGGDFIAGYSSDPENDASGIVSTSISMGAPVLVVKINYRVHAYGFMMGEAAQKANATNVGFLDQRLALEWIQTHIHAFGGDKEKVTIMGASAGGTAVVAQLILEGMDKKNLFRSAMYMSGAWAQNFDRQATIGAADDLYTLTNCTATNTTDQIACLRALSEDALFEQVVGTTVTYPGDSFGPYNDTVVFPTHPSVLIKQGYFAEVPIIAGNVLDEAGQYAPTTIATANEAYGLAGGYFTFATGINASTIWPYYATNLTDASPHYNNASVTASFGAYYPNFCTMAGNTWFESAREYVISYQSERSLPLWVYKFGEEYPKQNNGVYHYMDIPFWFNTTDTKDAGQLALAQQMMSALVSYTVTQDPAAISDVAWAPYSNSSSYMSWVADNVQMKPNTEHREALDYIVTLFP